MPDKPNAERERSSIRKYMSKPPLKLILPIAVISILLAGVGTALVFADNNGQTDQPINNTSTSSQHVTVEVGPNGTSVFEPSTEDPLRIEPGTTVKFVWKSNNNNIAVTDQPAGANWKGHERLEDAGFSITYTFQTEGTYSFVSQPYRARGMNGKIIVSESGSTPDHPITEQPTARPTSPSAPATTTRTPANPEETNHVTVEVSDYQYTPGGDEPLVIESGTTVTFTWKTSTHNIFVAEQPDGANWTGHEAIEDRGFSTTHTFNTTGVYEFYCQPHKSHGETGTIVVIEGNTRK